MTKSHKPSVKTKACAAFHTKMQRPRRDMKRNCLCEISESIQHDHLRKSPQKPARRNYALSVADETLLCEHILTLSNKNFVFDRLGLRMFVKAYLDRLGKRVNRFKDNFPGKFWAKAFFKRHSLRLDVLKAKTTRNSVADRIQVSRAIITGFQEELMGLLEEQPSIKPHSSSFTVNSMNSIAKYI